MNKQVRGTWEIDLDRQVVVCKGYKNGEHVITKEWDSTPDVRPREIRTTWRSDAKL